MMTMEELRSLAWRVVKGGPIHVKYALTGKARRSYHVLNSEDTVSYLLENDCSVARFGDGEFQMIAHYLQGGDAGNWSVDSFQDYDEQLAKRLFAVLEDSDSELLVCMPYPLFHSKVYRGYDRLFFEREWLGRQQFIAEKIASSRLLGDTTFTRFYLHRTDIHDYTSYLEKLKGIWHGKNIVIVEGEYSRLGVGNDLFDNAGQVHRIICPAINAFRAYDKIIESVSRQHIDDLFLLALGHTATVLASDMTKMGYRAIDVGHVDIEYEWYKMKATKKVPVAKKYVNEAANGRVSEHCDDMAYTNQIVERVV